MGVSWGGFIGSILCWGVPLRGVPIKGRFYGEGPIKGGVPWGKRAYGGDYRGVGGVSWLGSHLGGGLMGGVSRGMGVPHLALGGGFHG